MANSIQNFDALTIIPIGDVIRKQFEEVLKLYENFPNRSTVTINSRGVRIPLFQDNSHPWLNPDGIQSYALLLRGEIELPHDLNHCRNCREALLIQMQAANISSVAMNAPVCIFNPELVRQRLLELASSGRTI